MTLMPEGKGDGQGWTQVQRGLAVAAGQPRGKEIPPEECLAQQELWHGLAVRRGLGTPWKSWDSAAAPSQGLLPTRTDLFLPAGLHAGPTDRTLDSSLELLLQGRESCHKATISALPELLQLAVDQFSVQVAQCWGCPGHSSGCEGRHQQQTNNDGTLWLRHRKLDDRDAPEVGG